MPRRFIADDLLYLLTVADAGSTLAAAPILGVSQSTVSRRITALEQALGFPLFDKRRTGYELTEAALTLIEPARAVLMATDAFGVAADAVSRELTGTVRFTTNEVLATLFLPQLVAYIREKFPGIRIEADTSAALRDLSKGEVDVALRSVRKLDEVGLVGTRLAVDRWSLFCSRSYADKNGIPQTVEALADHALIGVESSGIRRPEFDWVRDNFPESSVVVQQNSVPAVFSSVRAGVGVGIYSEILAAGDSNLVPCFRPDLPPTAEIWLVTHERLKKTARIRTVMDAVRMLVKLHLAGLAR